MSIAIAMPVRPPLAPTVELLRAPSRRRSAGPQLAALRAPLFVKVVGANVLALVVMLLAVEAAHASPRWIDATAVLLAVLQFALVLVALRPVRDLEVVATRVWEGDLGARVERSSIADRSVLRLGAMFNILLDGLESDRERMRALAAEVIAVGDRERAALARELHDSTAQRMAALLLEIGAAARDCRDPALAGRLAAARDTAQQLTDELRLLAHTVHPRVLDDLGLSPALRKLARDSSHGTGVDVDVEVADTVVDVPHPIAAVLYRVAQEAVRNAIRHGAPRHVRLAAAADDVSAWLEVRDDGSGFDLAAVEARGDGMGLMSMRERLALVDGTLEIHTAPGGGTTIVAAIPTTAAPGRLREEQT